MKGILVWMFLIFLTLKLTGYIAWSWWLVTLPLWGPLATLLSIAGVCGMVAGFLESKSKL